MFPTDRLRGSQFIIFTANCLRKFIAPKRAIESARHPAIVLLRCANPTGDESYLTARRWFFLVCSGFYWVLFDHVVNHEFSMIIVRLFRIHLKEFHPILHELVISS